MNIVTIIVEILAGCGAFLLGFKLLSDNMEKIAGNSLKVLFNKTSERKLMNVGMGALTTAFVQSSSITTVMVVGFVNTGIMTLYQAATIIMGANIGTTITAQIAALQAFDVELVFMALLFVGVFMDLFSKKDKVKNTGLALAALGLVFVGLGLMSEPMAFLKTEPAVTEFLASVNNPILLLLVGAALTAIIQSSSALTTIVISLASAGLIIGGGGNASLYIILGSNVGTCITALISSIGASVNARRASVIHLLFNAIGSLIFAVVLIVWKDFNAVTFERWFPNVPSTQIAMFHTFFNVTCTLIFLPFTKQLVQLSTLLVPDRQSQNETEGLVYMDKRLLNTPAVAISQLTKEVFRMADMSMDAINVALGGFIARDTSVLETVTKKLEKIAQIEKQISDYFVQVSASGITLTDERLVNAMHTNLGDIARIADLADNFNKYTRREVRDNLIFSEGVNENIMQMHELLCKQYELVKKIVLEKRFDYMQESDALEDEIDGMRKELIASHITRLREGKCRPENNTVFINLVSNLERVGDHLNFIAHSLDDI